MPPFAGAPPRMLQVNTYHTAPDDEELDSPIDGMASMKLAENDKAAEIGSVSPAPLQRARPAINPRSTTHPSPSRHVPQHEEKQQPGERQQQRPSVSPRSRSPYSRSHLRSTSGSSNSSSNGSLLVAPLMTRAHSMPNTYITRAPDFTLAAVPPPSPSPASRSPRRVNSPFRQQLDGNYAMIAPPPRSPGFAAIERIEEDSELDTSRPRDHSIPTTTLASFSRSGSLKRRRPASPLHTLVQQQALPPTISSTATSSDPGASLINLSSALSSASNSPFLGPQQRQERFTNESYPQALHHYASTSSFNSSIFSSNFPSMPSTPTSMRSRSPSITSLDTIEDDPDMESDEALEFERFKEAAEKQEREAEDVGVQRRSSLDVPSRSGFGSGRGREGGRKRWSICGGERRGDLDLETIWED